MELTEIMAPSVKETKRATTAILPVKLERAQLYLNKELRNLLGWRSDENLICMVLDNVLVLYRENDYENIIQAISKISERLQKKT